MKKKSSSKSKWTPDLVVASDQPASSADAKMMRKLGAKLGLEEGAVSQEFVDDGLDSLLRLPKYVPGKRAADDDGDEDDDAAADTGRRAAVVKPKGKAKSAAAVAVAPTPPPAGKSVQDKKELDKARKAQREKKVALTLGGGGDADADAPKPKVKKAAAANSEVDALFDGLKKSDKKKKQQPATTKTPRAEGSEGGGGGGDEKGADDEVASIFDQLKALKSQKKAGAALVPTKRKASKGDLDADDGFAGRTLGGKRKFTEEGYPIYTEEELKLNSKGGDTPDCPFDCQCCF